MLAGRWNGHGLNVNVSAAAAVGAAVQFHRAAALATVNRRKSQH